MAEGIFAHEVVEGCRERRLLTDAICLTQRPVITFARRLVRDLREHRKPPYVLVRRGLHLMRRQRVIEQSAAARGCRLLTPDQAQQQILRLARSAEDTWHR